ncbi:uncharacterized protein LOC112568993 isoform X2 [Pomacea canaliculata]|uniref:uncharacterized protein LOC112568993 isoform X2 n=1 Tax=Pomacea canaliculata TaxID=400727 RepID=UPI000D73BB51|nr:uncharacterized protein LOC112568993 isoform X2 [Pomacea canaliculata]
MARQRSTLIEVTKWGMLSFILTLVAMSNMWNEKKEGPQLSRKPTQTPGGSSPAQGSNTPRVKRRVMETKQQTMKSGQPHDARALNINNSCRHDNQCPGHNVECFFHNCLCQPGFFLQTMEGACSATCNDSTLHNTFVKYPVSVLHGYYIGVHTHLSVHHCMKLCIQYKCLSFGYRAWGGRCLLHDVTALKDSSLWCPKSSKGWSHYQRTCLPDWTKEAQLTELARRCVKDDERIGWMVIQRRMNGSVDFYRNWTEYERGFGDPKGEFWLGLSLLHNITSRMRYKLHIDLGDGEGGCPYAEYSTFAVEGPETKYRLSVSDYTGTAGDSMKIHNKMAFTTYDQDNDRKKVNCAKESHGGWWYNSCHHANLNGRYKEDGTEGTDGINWLEPTDISTSFFFTEMRIRPNP